MNRLDSSKRAQIAKCLCEGNSLRATSRLTGCVLNTVIKFVKEVGVACADYHGDNVRGLRPLVIQCDELWSFVGCKMKNATPDKRAEGQGDAWTWVALDADSKLMITWNIGLRTEGDCQDFIDDLKDRIDTRPQISTDGFGTYKTAILRAFGDDVDYGMVVKMFNENMESPGRYSPAVCTSCHQKAVIGDPLESQISTSYIERQNLNIRMGCRRYTRLTNAFSKKLESHIAAFSLYAMHYNFCRPHQTLTKNADHRIPTTPAMASGLTDHVWTVEEMLAAIA